MTTFDLAKAMANGGKCQTRDGRPARIICVDQKDRQYPIVALVTDTDESPQTYTSDGVFYAGRHTANSVHDLVNIPVKREGWVNIYPADCGLSPGLQFHWTREGADKGASPNRAACVCIEWEE